MSRSISLCLKAGERIYVNGAVLRVNRKVTLELLNDAAFLLEGHVLQVEDTTTPLRQLYFVVQTMLIDPPSAATARRLFADLHAALLGSFQAEAVRAGLRRVAELVEAGRLFEALRTIRGLYAFESAVLGVSEAAANQAA